MNAEKTEQMRRARLYEEAIAELGGDLKKWIFNAEFHAEVEALVQARLREPAP